MNEKEVDKPVKDEEGSSLNLQSDGLGRVRKILQDIDMISFLSKFEESFLTDDALDCLKSESEMRDLLKSIVPLGLAVKFSNYWFHSRMSSHESNRKPDPEGTFPQVVQKHPATSTPDSTTQQQKTSPPRNKKSNCSPRSFGKPVKDVHYSKGNIFFQEENKEVEYKALTSESPEKLRWKMMEKARVFICGVLNAGGKGVIYFGIGDSYDQKQKFKRGEIVGLEVSNLRDEITKAFQFTLNDHIKSDDGKMEKGGDMNCIQIYFVPVLSSEGAQRFVVEIEVKHDWKFCKKKVYYCKEWKDKRVKTESKSAGLKDLYNTEKDNWEAHIRTCGETVKVKNIEIAKQIREPLDRKYKEWLDDPSRKHTGVPPCHGNIELDETDVKKYRTVARRSLRGLNYQENSYVLIASKVSPEHRGSNSLNFLRNVPWLAVFDLFDSNSEEDGLYYIFNETNDSARPSVKELVNFKSMTPNENVTTRGTTWIVRDQSMQDGDWIRSSKDCLYRALSVYKERCPTNQIHFVLLCLSYHHLYEIVDIIACLFSIIGEHANKHITIICQNKELLRDIVKRSSPYIAQDVKNCSISDCPWDLLRSIFKELLGPDNFNEPDATTDLPYLPGNPKPVLNKIIKSWTDLEVYCPNEKFEHPVEEIKAARELFYRGGEIKPLNLFQGHDIERTLMRSLTSRIDQSLKRLSQPSDITCFVETVTLRYESGSGATTLCRRILWNKKEDHRCAVVKAITSGTDYQIEYLQSIGFEAHAPPVLILVDNFPELDVRQLLDGILGRNAKCVLLNTVPIAKSTACTDEVLRKLDETEAEKAKRVLEDVAGKGDVKKAEMVLMRERRFFWLGLELFGREYIDIEKRLSNHINDIFQKLTDEPKKCYQMFLRFCCLLHYFSRRKSIYPHPCAVDVLNHYGKLSTKDIHQIDELHDKFGGLLLESYDESYAYYGWRPAHLLVSELVRKEMDLFVIAKELLMTMNQSISYTKNYLIMGAVDVFLGREKKSEGGLDNTSEPESALENSFGDEAFGTLEVRTRYSPLIKEIINVELGVARALDLLITLSEEVTEVQHQAHALQQIARVITYEIGMQKIFEGDPYYDQIGRIIDLVSPVCEPNRLNVDDGFKVAHSVIDKAIVLQPSYGHHRVTKGAIFMAELRELEKQCATGVREITDIVKQAIIASNNGISVYDVTLSQPKLRQAYLYAMIGKIQTVVLLLKILKNLPYFAQHIEGPHESFKSFMNDGTHSAELEVIFTNEELEYFLRQRILAIEHLNELYEEIKVQRTQTYNKYKIQDLKNAKLRAIKLREHFYEITGIDRTLLTDGADCPREIAYDILYQHKQTPFSGWKELPPEVVHQLHQYSLQTVTSRETFSDDTMLICVRSALQLQEKPSLNDVWRLVDLWHKKFPKSKWANLFQYMIHFPVPNGSLKSNVPLVKSAISCIRNKFLYPGKGYRRTGAEYLLGNGRGLEAIVRPHTFTKSEKNPWRSKNAFEKLERLRGQKIAGQQGVLRYRDIEIAFDNERYPKDSRDDLWFCLGFTINGPYAYDPIDKDTYKDLKKSFSETKSSNSLQPSVITLDDQPSITTDDWHVSRNSAKKIPKRSLREANSSMSVNRKQTKKRLPESSSRDPRTAKFQDREKLSFSSSMQREETSRTSNYAEQELWKNLPELVIPARSEEGSQRMFHPRNVDHQGRVHHGAVVKRTPKSSECQNHREEPVPKDCQFAHSWKSDTFQVVCWKCTNDGKDTCTQKQKHKPFIYKLGPYRNEQGKLWSSKR